MTSNHMVMEGIYDYEEVDVYMYCLYTSWTGVTHVVFQVCKYILRYTRRSKLNNFFSPSTSSSHTGVTISLMFLSVCIPI